MIHAIGLVEFTSIAKGIEAADIMAKTADVEIVAQLGSGKISLGQILKLKVGDVIPLNIPEKIEALVDSVPLMECTYGQQNGQYALKVERFIAAPPEAPAVPPATGDKNG